MLGYQVEVNGVLSEWKRGPQPYEGVLSAVCEAFHCLPDAAERQDWRKVKAILDYRTANWAIETFNDKQGGMKTLARHPELMEMLRDIVRAQTGANEAEADAALDAMRLAHGEASDGD